MSAVGVYQDNKNKDRNYEDVAWNNSSGSNTSSGIHSSQTSLEVDTEMRDCMNDRGAPSTFTNIDTEMRDSMNDQGAPSTFTNIEKNENCVDTEMRDSVPETNINQSGAPTPFTTVERSKKHPWSLTAEQKDITLLWQGAKKHNYQEFDITSGAAKNIYTVLKHEDTTIPPKNKKKSEKISVPILENEDVAMPDSIGSKDEDTEMGNSGPRRSQRLMGLPTRVYSKKLNSYFYQSEEDTDSEMKKPTRDRLGRDQSD